MKSHRNLKISSLSFCLPLCLILTGFLFSSCSESSANILSVNASVVFDYKDEKSLPETSLSVFIQGEYEAQRADFLKITEIEENYSWNVYSPVIFESQNKNWIGYPSLLAPEGKVIKNGEYEVLYTDAAGNEAEEKFFIKYNEEILKSKPENVRKAAGMNLSEVVILFDKNMNMLFYGTAKRVWKKNSDILKEYSRAFFKRRILTDTSGTVVIKLPLENLIEK